MLSFKKQKSLESISTFLSSLVHLHTTMQCKPFPISIPEHIELFKFEIRRKILKTLAKHPGLVSFLVGKYEQTNSVCFYKKGQPYVFMYSINTRHNLLTCIT